MTDPVVERRPLETGDVLVAHVTNPAWTPLFQHAAAVIVDSGGPAAHAGIVAREYGISAVMGTGDGTTRLTDGQTICADGHRDAALPTEEPLVPEPFSGALPTKRNHRAQHQIVVRPRLESVDASGILYV